MTLILKQHGVDFWAKCDHLKLKKWFNPKIVNQWGHLKSKALEIEYLRNKVVTLSRKLPKSQIYELIGVTLISENRKSEVLAKLYCGLFCQFCN